jgi:hypothetical protein
MTSLSPQGFDLTDPEWFLHDIDPGSGRAGFVRTDRASLSAEPFLDHRWRGADRIDAALPLASLPVPAEPPRLSFIWHTSFCASTLLAACLDSPGLCLALKEPRALVILAALKRSGGLGPGAGLAKSVFGLMARRFEADEQILIKPSNGANALIPEAAALTHGRMLLLYSDCESFILSMARQGRAGFAYVRERFASLTADGHPISRWPAAHLLRLTDLELAALVWRMEMDMLEAASQRLGDRARSLDCRLFLDDPGFVVAKADAFLGLGLGRERLDAVVNGPLLKRDAKHPGKAFDHRARAEEKARLRALIGPDLPEVVRSIDEAFPRPPKLAPPLVGKAAGRSPFVDLGAAAPAA